MNHRLATLIVVTLGLVIACAPKPVEPPGEDGAGEVVVSGAGETESTACERPAPQHVLVARISDGKVEIDEDHHSDVTVGRGEQVEFACPDCPSDLEFTAFDLHPFLDLAYLYDQEVIDALEDALKTDDLERLRDQLAPAFLRLTGDEGGRRSVPYWETGLDKARYSSKAFWSPPVPDGAEGVYWKFTWRVRQKGDQSECMESDLCAEWDPHIVTK